MPLQTFVLYPEFDPSRGAVDQFAFNDASSSILFYTDISLSDSFAFRDNCYILDDDRLYGEWDIATFVWGDETGYLEWMGDHFRVRPSGEYLTFIQSVFDIVGFNDILLFFLCNYPFDLEIFCWDYLKYWDSYEWNNVDLVDLEKQICIFDTIGFQDIMNCNHVVNNSEEGFAWGNDAFWIKTG